MNRISKFFILALAVLAFCLCFAACGKAKEVTFIVDGKEAIKLAADKEGKIFEPKIDIEDSIFIVGWYANKDYDGETFDFAIDVVEEDITLYAKLASHNYTVTYNLGYTQPEYGEEMPAAPVQGSVNLDETFEVAPVPIRVGYEFLGWTDGTNVYQPGDIYEVEVNGNITLTATWKTKMLHVRFFDDVGVIAEKDVPYNSSVIAPSEVSHTYPYAYQFDGWDKQLTNITADTDITAQWTYQSSEDSNFTFTLNDDGNSYTISKADDFQIYPQRFILPKEHDGKPVTAVAELGFNGNYDSEFLYIPSSIKVLNTKAFYSNCYLEIVFEEGVTTIGDQCFGYCDFLEEINLPSSISQFGKNVFTGCANLSDIYVEKDNAVLSAEDNTLYNKDKTKIYWVSTLLTDYTIIESVTEIPTALFRGSRTLKSVTINADLEWLPCSTFMECNSLTTVTINGVIENVAGLYDNPDAIDDPDMPGYVDTTNFGAFMMCRQLSSITFPEGLKYIGKAAFARCSSLTTINLPSTVETIADDAFWTQPVLGKLTTITLTGNENDNFILDQNACLIRKGTQEDGNTVILWANGSNIANYVIPDGVKNIVPAAFMRSPNLVSITIPEGVTEIPAQCFFYCPNLTTVNLSSTLTEFVSEYPIKYGGHDISGFNGSFELCENLSTINLQDTALTKIGGRAFYGCGITEVNLPSATIEIESNAFYGCPIESFDVETNNEVFITDNKSLYTVDGELYYFAVADTQITEYSVPDTINTIKGASFYQHKLSKVILPGSVTFIEQGAFESYTENFEGEYTLTWHQFTVEFLGITPPQLEGLNPLSAEVEIIVPETAFKAYYMAFYGTGYEEMIDDSLVAKTTFVFNANGGTAVDNIIDVCLKSMPLTDWNGEGQKYFHGWFADDGVWQQEISIPYFYEGEGNTVTLYAKWGEEKREDGSSELFAYQLSDTMRTLTLDNGTYYFTFTVSGFGLYDIQATLTFFDYVTAYTVYDQQGISEIPYFYTEDDQMKITVIITIEGLDEPTEFEMGITNYLA